MTDSNEILVNGKLTKVDTRLLGYDPFRPNMDRECPICGAPRGALCVATRHPERRTPR